MKLATTIGDFESYTSCPAEAVAAFEGTGFKHLDYSFYSVIYPNSPFLGENWKKEVTDAGETAAKLGLDFVQAHSPSYNPLDPHFDHQAGMLATLRSIEACSMLGIRNLVVHSGYTEDYTYPDGREGFFAANERFYRSLVPAMEKFNVNVLIENSAEGNMGKRYYFMTGREMTDFIEEFNHPLLQAVWDIGHANMRGADQYKDICDLGCHLNALHIQDNFGTFDEHFAPLMGTCDMDAVIQALLKIGYDGYFTFESERMLNTAGGWPHRRAENPNLTHRRIANPNLALRRVAEKLLYQIGKFMLESYDCFED
ncbi:MAG: sugar phosphate isomerase/epimerase [Ruminococcaceae bacterium]|nr:sugar phosphate isomerase/epimerase [Oscillospiraceae bacterium]